MHVNGLNVEKKSGRTGENPHCLFTVNAAWLSDVFPVCSIRATETNCWLVRVSGSWFKSCWSTKTLKITDMRTQELTRWSAAVLLISPAPTWILISESRDKG